MVSIIMLNKSEQQIALELSRQTLDKAFDNQTEISQEYKKYKVFFEKRGVFVTLHKHKHLRGCIGLIENNDLSLAEAIKEMVLAAAFSDHRFPVLEPDELPFVDIEISVLTIPKKIKNIDEIKMGQHGVIIRKGLNTGVFLPQVATETGWDKEKFLSELCSQKAGLDLKCYLDKDMEIYTFEAQIFSE